jgi:hypothetical protein
MRNDHSFQLMRWASLAFAAGGLLMAVLWIVYTTVHGPTSFDHVRSVLGRTTLFWGMLLSAPPNLLVALGLVLLYPPLAKHVSRRLARVGYTLTLLGLVIPAGIDLYIRAISPPFFVPVVGIGLILLSLGIRHHPQLHRQDLFPLMFIGIFQIIAFSLALIPLEVSDQIDGYRIYGIFAHLLPGIGWVLLGASLWKKQAVVIIEPVQN